MIADVKDEHKHQYMYGEHHNMSLRSLIVKTIREHARKCLVMDLHKYDFDVLRSPPNT